MRLRTLIILLIALLAGYVVLIAVGRVASLRNARQSAHNEVTQRYIENALEDTGVLNMVTAIVLDYRAYDTMFETIVLFTAVLAVIITLKNYRGKGWWAMRDFVLKRVAALLLPFIQNIWTIC